jgi:hypothetical protein
LPHMWVGQGWAEKTDVHAPRYPGVPQILSIAAVPSANVAMPKSTILSVASSAGDVYNKFSG